MQASKLKIPLALLAFVAVVLILRWISGPGSDQGAPGPAPPPAPVETATHAGKRPPPAARPVGEGVLVPPKEKPEAVITKAPPRPPPPVPKDVPVPLIGLSVSAVPAEERERQKLPEKVVGVMITGVDPASQAAEAKLQPGDVIYEAHNTPVVDEASLRAGVGARDHTMIKAFRNGHRIAVVLHTPFKGD